MKEYCKNHQGIIAVNICHCCGNYFCENCLVEGAIYYYCTNETCQKELQKESADFAQLEQRKKKDKLLYELKESNFPFITVSFIIAALSCFLLGDFDNNIFTILFLILMRTFVLWGIPFILSAFLFWVVTIKELRSKLYYFAYFITWTAFILLYYLGSYSSFSKGENMESQTNTLSTLIMWVIISVIPAIIVLLSKKYYKIRARIGWALIILIFPLLGYIVYLIVTHLILKDKLTEKNQ
ncbi:MAG: hypothetical protein CO128_00470 [Ignavibacteriales bacterium CG_4_9_14_3_um_filter_30_11]|nr:MAG: hypothetical protein CO128_00470 [Ignavibacteriales bacterium CG_4_9_14_3_um_filter_30_11]